MQCLEGCAHICRRSELHDQRGISSCEFQMRTSLHVMAGSVLVLSFELGERFPRETINRLYGNG